MQPSADRAAMQGHAMNRAHFHDDLVQRQVTLDHQPLPQPVAEGRNLAHGMVALNLGRKTPALPLQDDHIVQKARRDPKVPRGFSVPMTLLDKGDDPAAKFHRM